MFSIMTKRPLALLLTSFALVTACAPSDVLYVQDPDIINPADVQSPAGADAVRLGALARFTSATSGAEGLFLLGGLFADEWVNGDSFIARQEIDQRVITIQNTFLLDANRVLHRTRLSAEQAIQLLEKYNPNAPAYQVGEMYFVQAFVINMMAEHYCDGLVFSDIVDGREEYGSPITTAAAYDKALTLVNQGIALVTGTSANDQRVRNALLVLKGRVLLNQNKPAEAATVVAGVPTSFAYNIAHSQTTQINTFWNFNNNARRYSVSANEGTNGLNYATANDPRVPVCLGGTTACNAIGVTLNRRDDLSSPLYAQMLWPARESPVAIVKGVEARMIEAEAQLRAGNSAAALTTLNTARATVTGLTPLTDPTTPEARVDQLFRERAFWMFGTGHRVGDLRRLIRQYNRAQNTVFPTGQWHKGGNYGIDVTVPVPQAEQNNPNLPASATETCLARTA
jgi:hypothetical protein